MPNFKRLCIVVNRSKPGAEILAAKLLKVAEACGANVNIAAAYPIPPGTLEGADLCCVIGGDGSILSVAAEALRSGTPVMGINLGKLGFMATSSPDDALEKLEAILGGGFSRSERTTLRCVTACGEVFSALNDVVIKSAEGNRLIEIEVLMNGDLVTPYYCDGLIFASPTGSTAYNLSAGGPLIDPSARNFAMTPICPHTLANRSVVFSADASLTVRVDTNRTSPQVTIDGIHLPKPVGYFPLTISTDPRRLTLIHSLDYSAFDVVRNKLGWAR